MLKSINFILFLIIITGTSNATSGVLEDFESAKDDSRTKTEREAKNQSSNNSHHHRQHSVDDEVDTSFGEFFAELVFKGIWYTALYGGSYSIDRYADFPENKNVIKRRTGEPLIPEYRFDYHFQKANATIEASDFRVEIGKGDFGIQFRTTAMTEVSIDDHLRLNQIHGLYRMSFGNYIGFDFGIGAAQLIGNNRQTNFSMTMPIYFHPSKHVGFSMKTNGHFFSNAEILDRDYSVILTQDYGSVTFGYRELVKVGQDIRGPYVGFSAHY